MKRIFLGSGFAMILSLGLVTAGCGEDTADPQEGGSGGKPAMGGKSTLGGSTGTSTGGSTQPGENTAKGGAAMGGNATSGGNTTSTGGSTATSGGGSTKTSGGSTKTSGGSTTATGGKPGGNQDGGALQGGSTTSTGGSTSNQGGSTSTSTAYYKPRIIATTDGEVDDRSTFVRFLMYSSDYDVKGIVQVNSRYQKKGHSGEKWVEKEIDLYGQTLDNLKVHHPGFPSPSALSSVVRVGNENEADLFKAPPEMSVKETAGSKLIIDTLLDGDPRHLHVPSWGGANTTAYALYTMKTTMPEKLAQVISKLWIYCIWYQDNGGKWIEDNIPGVYIYEAYRWDNIWDYQSLTGPSPDDVKAFMTAEWLNQNVKNGHGPLGAYTPQKYVSEGDTPSFLPLIDNGLYQHMDYTWGGWGGRPVFAKKGNYMTDKGATSDDGNEYKSFWRWIIDLENDFAGRMDWAVAKTYAEANHNPKAKVVGDLVRDVKGGEVVTLDASPTTDPDGNNLSYEWWQYVEAGTASKITIENAKAKTTSFTVPNEPGKKIHVILKVLDDGKPPMPHWARIIFNIK